jgi:electron transport complex protein RnfB
MTADLVDQIDVLLPQTQCTKCGYQGCRPYAEAIARGAAEIDRCPPGGADGIAQLAALLGREVRPLNPAVGVEQPRAAALIDESWCIGCTLCIQACPVDAIVGARKLMHTVLLQHCTGCELCIPPCPVDCIDMVELSALVRRAVVIADPGPEARSAEARARYQFHLARIAREREEQEARLAANAGRKARRPDRVATSPGLERKQAAIRAARERARVRRAGR